MEETLTMSNHEIDRLRVIQKVLERRLSWRQAGEELGLCMRQIGYICARIRSLGNRGIIHRLRGRPSNRRLKPELLEQALDTVKKRYWDFGPTLANEKLASNKHAKDSATGIPAISLYGKSKRPTHQMLANLDALVFDIQDIGVRFYTYATTMAYALEEAAATGIEFYVLDRPNPLTGAIVEGEILSSEVKHFTAYFSIPVRHGLTIGELANWYNVTANIGANLHVIKMQGWNRTMWWKDSGLPFIAPSPNISSPQSALLYSGIGGFEATNISVGRGTKHPFEQFGAPWTDGKKLAEKLNGWLGVGVTVKAVRFTPKRNLYAGQRCQGVRLKVKDKNKIRPVDIFVAAVVYLKAMHPTDFRLRWEEVKRVTGTSLMQKLLEPRGMEESLKKPFLRDLSENPETWIQALLYQYHQDSAKFLKSRQPYLLY